jgi:hypothetical protein
MILEPMPKPDGAPNRCCANVGFKTTWPFTEIRCEEKPVGMVPSDLWWSHPEIHKRLIHGPVTCQKHAVECEAILSE